MTSCSSQNTQTSSREPIGSKTRRCVRQVGLSIRVAEGIKETPAEVDQGASSFVTLRSLPDSRTWIRWCSHGFRRGPTHCGALMDGAGEDQMETSFEKWIDVANAFSRHIAHYAKTGGGENALVGLKTEGSISLQYAGRVVYELFQNALGTDPLARRYHAGIT